MESSKLTPKQQKKTLSARKKPLVTIKNILCSPYNTNLWPAVSVSDSAKIAEIFQTMPPAPQILLPHYSKLKLIPKPERPRKLSHPIRKYFFCGISELTRSLQKKQCIALLIDADIDPKVLVKHLITLAADQKVPVLCIPNLKGLIKKFMQFKCACIGIRRNIDHPIVKKLSKTISDISTFYNIGPATEKEHSSTILESGLISDLKIGENGDWLSNKTKGIQENLKPNTESSKYLENTTDYEQKYIGLGKKFQYLKRINPNDRVFVPRKKSNDNVNPSSTVDFLQVDTAVSVPVAESSNFKPMVLQRYRGNPNRPVKNKKK